MDQPKRSISWYYWVGAALFFYAISYGPLVYIRNLMPLVSETGRIMWSVVKVVYYPHVYLHGKSEYYYNYCGWWTELARGPDSVHPWEEFKKWDP